MSERRRKNCEAEVHAPACDGLADDRDHFKPKCIAQKIERMKKQQVNSRENIQWLNRSCHIMKDSDTPKRFYVLKRGNIKSWEHHIATFLGAEYADKYRRMVTA